MIITIVFLLTGSAVTWSDWNFAKVLGGNNNSDDSENKDMNYEQNNMIRRSNSQNHLPKQVLISNNSSWQHWPDVYGNKIVWSDRRNGNDDIYMYDLGQDEKFGTDDDVGEIQITNESAWQQSPKIYGNKIVWDESDSDGLAIIYMYDLGPDGEFETDDDVGKIPITNKPGYHRDPEIYENKIIWGGGNICMYDLGSDGIFNTADDVREVQITNDIPEQYSTDIYENKIVWVDIKNNENHNEGEDDIYDIWMYDLGSDGKYNTSDDSGKIQITNETTKQYNPAIYEDKIIWGDRRNSYSDIYMYDLGPDGKYNTTDDVGEVQITNNPKHQYLPAIHENKIIWTDDRNDNQNIYMYDLGPDGKFNTSDDSVEVRITDEPGYQKSPAIYKDKIVWQCWENKNWDVYMLNLSSEPQNNPPVLEHIPYNLFAQVGEPFHIDANATDSDNDTLTYSDNTDLFDINEVTGEIYWIPKEKDIGTYKVKFSVDDGWGGIDEKEVTLEVNEKPRENRPPILEDIPDTLYAQVEKSFYLDVNATDLDGDTLTYLEDSLLFEIDERTGEVYWIPKENDVGIYFINISVSDGNDGWDYSEFTLNVMNIYNPPILYDGNLIPSNGDTSTNFTFSVMYKAIDGDRPVNIGVIIDDNLYAMVNNDSLPSDFKRGARYSYTRNLIEGVHRYYYSVSDGTSIIRFPQNGNLTTPYIQRILKNETEIRNVNNTGKDSDNDTYNDTFELSQGSNPYNPFSTPFDWDADGWNNSIESRVGTDPWNNFSIPLDSDTDGIPDSIDLDRDGYGIANVDDPYPNDGDRWERESIDEDSETAIYVWVGIFILVFIIAVAAFIRYPIKKRNENESEQTSEDELGIMEKGEIKKSE